MMSYVAKYPRGFGEFLYSIFNQVQLKRTSVTQDGAELFPNFLDRSLCEEIRTDAARYFHQQVPPKESGAFVLCRSKQTIDSYDRFVFQLVNYQVLRPDICDPIIARLEKVASDAVGKPARVVSLIVQRDFPDQWTKRPFHSDSMNFSMKSFTYLNDVLRTEDGPYVYVEGSHRRYLRRLSAMVKNFFAKSYRYDDLFRVYTPESGRAFLAPAGSMILSIQSGAHKGFPDHTGNIRDVLVAIISIRNKKGLYENGKFMSLTEAVPPEAIHQALKDLAESKAAAA